MRATDAWRRFRVPLLWVGAIGFGLLGASGARNYIAGEVNAEKRRLTGNVRWAEVVVAKRALEVGSVLSPDTMAVRKLRADLVPDGAIRPAEFDAYDGEVLRQAMHPGEPLFVGAVSSRDDAALSSRIPPGTRAMTIGVDEVNSVSGMLRPGDRIDLMLSVRARAGDTAAPVELATPLMSDLRVLATGARTGASGPLEPASERFSAITVEVTPEQAQRLILAQRSGRITALLRRPGDTAPSARSALGLPELLGIARRSVSVGPELIVGGQGPLRPRRSPRVAVPTGATGERS